MDLIDRQAAIKELRKMAIALYGYDATSVISCAIYKLQNLPSAQPEEYTIEMQEVDIDEAMKHLRNAKVMKLPSAQTEIIRCGQCKYAEVADKEDAQD